MNTLLIILAIIVEILGAGYAVNKAKSYLYEDKFDRNNSIIGAYVFGWIYWPILLSDDLWGWILKKR